MDIRWDIRCEGRSWTADEFRSHEGRLAQAMTRWIRGPADVAVALELALRPGQGLVPLATAVGISLGEAHNAVSRLRRARLLRPDERRIVAPALADFLVHGVPYAFPGELGAETRGVPTGHAGPSLAREFKGDPIVWASVDGRLRGQSLVPLYPAAPRLAGRVPDLYDLLTLVDALRVGRARERSRAAALLRAKLVPAS